MWHLCCKQFVRMCVALRTWNVLTPRRWEPCDAARTEISVITEINRIICYPSLCNGSTVFKSLHLFLPSLPFLLNMEANPHPPRSFLSPVLWPRISWVRVALFHAKLRSGDCARWTQYVSAWQVCLSAQEDVFWAQKHLNWRGVIQFLLSKPSGLWIRKPGRGEP